MKPEAPDQRPDSYADDLGTPWWADAPRCAECRAGIDEDLGPLCAECKAEQEHEAGFDGFRRRYEHTS